MRYAILFVVLAAAGAEGPIKAQAQQSAGGTSLETAAQEWLGRAESGDLIPAWNVKEPPKGIPPAYDVAPAVIKEARTRCRFHSEKERRALLLCLQIFGAYRREDTPRTGLRISCPVPAIIYIPPPPRAQVDVR